MAAPERLVYTWRWELASMDVDETLVAESCVDHVRRWDGTLDRLEKIF